MSGEFREGDLALLLSRDVEFLVKLEKGRELHTHLGKISCDDILGGREGDVITTSTSEKLLVVKPDFQDKLSRIRRGPQIIHPKDAYQIIRYLSIGPGREVLEVGGGSGYMTCILAYLVGENGRVVSYEKRKDFSKIIKRNLDFLGLSDRVDLREEEFRSTDEKFDAAVIDVGNPFEIIEKVIEALKPGGRFSLYLPTMDQLVNLSRIIPERVKISALETVERKISLSKGKVKPMGKLIGHTAYLVIGRRLF